MKKVDCSDLHTNCTFPIFSVCNTADESVNFLLIKIVFDHPIFLIAMSCNPVSQGAISSARVPPATYIVDLPPSKNRELCEHCDEIDVWMQMAAKMGFSDDDADFMVRCDIMITHYSIIHKK